jgi:outer membrane biosynthesis protein TonB
MIFFSRLFFTETATMSTSEQRIREFAYQIWESEGKPHGHTERHWEMASKLAQAHAASANQPELKLQQQTASTEPAPSIEPIEPISPTQPAQPVPPSDPIQPTDPVQPNQPEQPNAPHAQTQQVPEQPVKPKRLRANSTATEVSANASEATAATKPIATPKQAATPKKPARIRQSKNPITEPI